MSDDDPRRWHTIQYEAVHADHWPFTAGEILIVPGVYEREFFGGQRKTAKWDVETSFHDTPEAALAHLRSIGVEPKHPEDYDYGYGGVEAVRALLRLYEAHAAKDATT